MHVLIKLGAIKNVTFSLQVKKWGALLLYNKKYNLNQIKFPKFLFKNSLKKIVTRQKVI